jgi:hypothetical protein
LEAAKIEDISDELAIQADVHKIKEMNPNEINSELIERYLSILSRTFKNLEDLPLKKEDTTKIFNYILDSYCNFGFYIIDEFTTFTKQEMQNETSIDFTDFPELDLLKFISGFSPLISQTWLFDGLGHYNLEQIIKDEIEKLEKDANNQYRLFLLYFLLLDIDLHSNSEYIERAIENIKIKALKYAIFLKLNYYLTFKGGHDKNLQHKLSNCIQKSKLKLDNKTNIGEIQMHIQEKKRIALLNKNE